MVLMLKWLVFVNVFVRVVCFEFMIFVCDDVVSICVFFSSRVLGLVVVFLCLLKI